MFLSAAVGAMISASALIIANVIDAYPYWAAVRHVRALDEAALRSIAECCARMEPKDPQTFRTMEGKDLPQEIRTLSPRSMALHRGFSVISLFSREDFASVYLVVSTHSENQTISFHSNAYGKRSTMVLWERNPEFNRQLYPLGRIATFIEQHMRHQRTWILRPNELLIIDHQYGPSSPKLYARISLSAEQRALAENVAKSIGSDIRGHAFDSGGMDGVTVKISFDPEGKMTDGMILANAWRNEVTPLTDLLANIAGEQSGVPLTELVAWLSDPRHNNYIQTHALAEYHRRKNYVPLPWWRLWPRFESTTDSEFNN